MSAAARLGKGAPAIVDSVGQRIEIKCCGAGTVRALSGWLIVPAITFVPEAGDDRPARPHEPGCRCPGEPNIAIHRADECWRCGWGQVIGRSGSPLATVTRDAGSLRS